jgi:hypothetical protein
MVSRLVLVLLSLTITLTGIEVALRAAGYKPTLSSAWLLGNGSRIPDEDVVTIDRRFVQDDFYRPYQDRGDAKLLVTLGDSFTASFPVGDADRYPAVLETILGKHSFNTRVLNVGLGDSGTDQQLKLFTTYVLPRVRPDIVVWQFYPNDTYENAIKAVYSVGNDNNLVPVGAKDNWLYRRQRFFDSVPLPTKIKRESYLFNLILRWYERGLEAAVPPGKDKLEWGRHKIARGIARMEELAAQHGFRVYYTVVAPEADYKSDVPHGSAGTVEAVEYQRLLSIVQSKPTFINGRLGTGSAEELSFSADLFADGTRDPSPYGARHFNEAGYRFLATRIANRVLRDHGVPVLADQLAAVSTAPIHVEIGAPAARRFLRRGFQPDEPGSNAHVWSDGLTSVIELPLPKGSDIRMDFECSPFSFPGSPQQTISIVLNGTPIQQVALTPGRAMYSVMLPKGAFRDWPDTLELTYAYARKPMDVISGAGDSRTLAVVYNSIDFTPVR